MEVQVSYQSIDFDLIGNYREAESDVNFNSEFEIITAEIQGVDVTILLSNEQIEDLQNLANEQIER